MDISKLTLSNAKSVHASLSIYQATDSPSVDTQNSLSSPSSNEQSCCRMLLDLIQKFIDWVVSLFCAPAPSPEAPAYLKEFIEMLNQQKEEEHFVNDGPLQLLKNLIDASKTVLELDEHSSTLLSLLVHAIKTDASGIKKTRITDFCLSTGEYLLKHGKLNEDMILESFESCAEDTREDLRQMIQEHNGTNLPWNGPGIIKRFSSEEEETHYFGNNAPLLLVAKLILDFQDLNNGTSALAFTIRLLETEKPRFTRTKLRDFYLTVGTDLLKTGKINEKKLLDQFKPTKIPAQQLHEMIQTFNQTGS